MAFNPTSAAEARAEERRQKKNTRKPYHEFICNWCSRRFRMPFVASDPHNPADAYMLIHAPDPWVTVNRRDCCPDCFEAYLPPRVMPATET